MATTEKVAYEIGLKDKLTGPLNKATGQANKLDGAMGRIGRSSQKTGSIMGGIIKANLLTAAAQGLFAVGAGIIKAGIGIEQTRIAFQTMVGDVEKGNKILGQVQEFANITPFDTDAVTKASRTLLGFGVTTEELFPTLKILGDISAGTGKDLSELGVIYGQIRGAGKLMGGDLLQLINAGFNPLQTISKRTGETMGELKTRMSKGAIGFKEVQQAFIDATGAGGRFNNLMIKQSKTVGGRWSTLVGKIQLSAAKIGEALLPIMSKIVASVMSVVDWFQTSGEGLKLVFSPLVEVFNEVRAELGGLFSEMTAGFSVVGALKGAFNLLGNVLRFLKPVFSVMAKAFVFIIHAMKRALDGLKSIIQALSITGRAFRAFGATIVATFVTIRESATNILSSVGDLLAGIFSGDIDQIKKGLSGLKNSFSKAGSEGSKAFHESFQSKEQDFFKDTKKIKETGPSFSTQFSASSLAAGSANSTAGGKAGKQASSSVNGVSSGRPTTINVTIGKLVENFVVQSDSIEDLENKVRDIISRTLVSAVNDVNLIAK